ncbi:hypothetical protein F5144DRAFT_593239 [Chaetomium tenue]|uniref:Uncharacterized protein n=1 Tax=Chaetomium tenue TaxID=1854479 RepID=A0ACB7P933_9PEZI|nr:hypothetical protein F5144DRAFT_593239 [Chaetomium globosum]
MVGAIFRLEGLCWVVLCRDAWYDNGRGYSDARRGECGARCNHPEPPPSIVRAGFPTPRRALGLPSRQGATRKSGSGCRCKIQQHKYHLASNSTPPPPERSPGMTAVNEGFGAPELTNPSLVLGVNVTDSHTDPNVHYVEITYDFSWPGDGSLDSTPGAAKNPNGTFCVVAPTSWGTAKNITDKYTDANTHSTDCTPVLGSACVDAILTASAENDDGTRYGCLHGPWSKYPECADTFGIAEYAPYQKQGLELEVNSLESRYFRSGETFNAFTEGGVLPDTNSPGLYESAVNMLQVVLLRPPVAGPGERPSPTLNCMRVNTKEVVDGGSGSEDGNSGASRHVAAGGIPRTHHPRRSGFDPPVRNNIDDNQHLQVRVTW